MRGRVVDIETSPDGAGWIWAYTIDEQHYTAALRAEPTQKEAVRVALLHANAKMGAWDRGTRL